MLFYSHVENNCYGKVRWVIGINEKKHDIAREQARGPFSLACVAALTSADRKLSLGISAACYLQLLFKNFQLNPLNTELNPICQ